MYQVALPDKYQQMTPTQAEEGIARAKRQLGSRLIILGHHYQRDEIIQFADYTGDSFKLSQRAAQQKYDPAGGAGEFIVFCGVHFMAESADILTADAQKVFLPDMTAGCSMADMADLDQVQVCWQYLQQNLPHPERLVPITYVNSTAAIKSFCGRHGGCSCTSSNCRKIFEYYRGLDPQAVILFLPDEHLGRNTAWAMGVDLENMVLWNPYEPDGGTTEQNLKQSKIILWKGFCSVHQGFTVEQITRVRRDDPKIKIIVHPECCFEVIRLADYVGSTSYIVETIQAAEAGSSWAVGTEINLVNRLARKMAPKNILVRSLSGVACLCETMYRIDLPHLAWLLDMLVEYVESPDKVRLHNQVVVPAEIKKYARISLEKMLEITA